MKSACEWNSADGADVNISDAERRVSVLAGGCLLLLGLSRLSMSTLVTALAGGALIYRGVTGHCSAYDALNISTAEADKALEKARRPLAHGLTDASLAATGELPRPAL